MIGRLLQLILFLRAIDAWTIDFTVVPAILQHINHPVVGTIGIANMSNEVIHFELVQIGRSQQFPLMFSSIVYGQALHSDRYIFSFHLYKSPRNPYDIPLWSADTIESIDQTKSANHIHLIAHTDAPRFNNYIMGVITCTEYQYQSPMNTSLVVQVGPNRIVNMHVHQSSFPILFIVDDVPLSNDPNPTEVTVSIRSYQSQLDIYRGRNRLDLRVNASICHTLLFKVALLGDTNLTLVLTAHVLNSLDLTGKVLHYKVYDRTALLYETSELLIDAQFPISSSLANVPIPVAGNYTIEAAILGESQSILLDGTLFLGARHTRLVPRSQHTVMIQMRYTGLNIGTSIVGVIRGDSPNASTWPLSGANLALVVANQDTNQSESFQSILYNRKFPIEFVLMNLDIIANNQNGMGFSVSIMDDMGNLLWQETTAQIIRQNQINHININLTRAAEKTCATPNTSPCSTHSPSALDRICCAEFICTKNGICTAHNYE